MNTAWRRETGNACEGVLIGSQPWKRVHCNGCERAIKADDRARMVEDDGRRLHVLLTAALADAAALREQLAAYGGRSQARMTFSYVLTGDCPSCGEPFDRRYGGFDCVCQLNGHRTDACLGLDADCVCGQVRITRDQIARILRSVRQ